MLKYFLLSMLLVLSFPQDVIKAQDDQPGYISIDCGLQRPNYTDPVTKLYYTSDTGFVDSGVSQSVSSLYQSASDIDVQFKTLRYFPEGSRNCYTLRPGQGKSGKYLIRARFMYGNYDDLNQLPTFDLHIGNQYWDTIAIINATLVRRREIVHTPLSDYIHVCLVKTGPGIPFISTLELRPLDPGVYPTKQQNVSLNLVFRVNMNPIQDGPVRFKDDIYDRIWMPLTLSNSRTINTTSLVNKANDFLKLPTAVMSTAAEAINTSGHCRFYWDAPNATLKHFWFLHFSELEVLEANQTRLIDIYLNDDLKLAEVSPTYLLSNTVYNFNPSTGNTTYIFDIAPNPGTTLPPIINAAEVYSLIEFPLQETYDGDVKAMVSIKAAYNLTENWQGDPCGPEGFKWNGVNCTNNDGLNKPKIISLNLSAKRLVGSIAPAIFELKALKTLDLSDNFLTGGLPEFLTEFDSLTVLNLKGNNFSKSCPQQLIDKANSGKLTLISDDSLCGSSVGDPCLSDPSSCKKKKKSSVVVPIGATAGGVFFVICASFFAFYIIKRQKRRATSTKVDTEADKRFGIADPKSVAPIFQISNSTTETMISSSSQKENPNFVVPNRSRQFTYHEVLQITNNFQRVIGKGGFGSVYHGYVGDTQVAVKILSKSSAQGYKEFQAEASLLVTIHHKNLTSLVGYCYEGTNMAIIYEYMANGSMDKHLLGKGPYVLTWEERLRMAIDAAQGLEYLHHGCIPAIVHRDVKMTNILLDENFRAKLADFGLSRAFSIEDATHVSTVVAGTPGYLDPEYFSTTRLTEKSDVYSFGIVLLEIVTGHPALPKNNEMTHIITWVSLALEKGDIGEVADPKLQGDYAINSIWKVLEAAMSCVARNSARRPTMNFVVMELKASLSMEISRNETESKDSIGLVSLNMESGFNPQAR